MFFRLIHMAYVPFERVPALKKSVKDECSSEAVGLNKISLLQSFSYILFVLLLQACGGGGGGSSSGSTSTPDTSPKIVTGTLPTPAPTPTPTPTPTPNSDLTSALFVDVTTQSGIQYKQGYINVTGLSTGEAPLPEMIYQTTSGVASGDFDNDGDIDLFVVRGDIGPNLLYRNEGNMTFTDVALSAGLAYTKTAYTNNRHSGPVFADIDGDEDLDLFIGAIKGDPPLLFRNNGNGTFTNITRGSGIDQIQSLNTVTATFGDYDLDGDLDMLLSHFGTPKQIGMETEHLWRNDTVGQVVRFTNVSKDARISDRVNELIPSNGLFGLSYDYSYTPTFARINDDLYPDILLVSDLNTTQVFMNNKDGTFSEATDREVIKERNGMGSALADYDNDGDLDWFVTSIYVESAAIPLGLIGNRFYRNDDGIFVDTTEELGVNNGGWGWGACFTDFDNNTTLDLYHTNGWLEDSGISFKSDPSRFFVHDENGDFEDMAGVVGLADTEMGRGIVCADFDNDGDIDIFQTHFNPNNSASLYRNDSQQRNYLTVKLRGKAGNIEATGARIYATTGELTQMREIMIGNNYTSQNPTLQFIGLNNLSQVDRLRVEWPDGKESVLLNVQANQNLTLDYPAN